VTQTAARRRFGKLAAAINQKAARLRVSGRLTADDLAWVYLEADRRCQYCGIDVTPGGVSFDHIVPWARGGSNSRSNLACSCITCQRTKFTKSPAQLAEYQALTVRCEVCQREFRPRWADWIRGYGRTCSRVCSGTKGGQQEREAS
jgi:hypothetical protein